MGDEFNDQFDWLLKQGHTIADAIGFRKELILEIYRASTDWEFILKIDAILEATAKLVVKANLLGSDRLSKVKVDGFVDTLPMRGRTSLLALLKATGCGKEELDLIDCVRRLRNGFAHDIRQVDSSLIEVIKRRPDKPELIRSLCYIASYEEGALIERYEKDGSFLRFSILHGALTFLALAYHVGMEAKPS